MDAIWVNFQGEEIKYTTIDPSRVYINKSYPGHIWRFKQNGRVVCEWTLDANQTEYVISNQAK